MMVSRLKCTTAAPAGGTVTSIVNSGQSPGA